MQIENFDIKIAGACHSNDLINFFSENLDQNNKAVYNREFFCPLGLRAAINRKQMAVLLINDRIIAAARFYPRKRDNTISLYQFAVRENFRNQKLMNRLFTLFGSTPIETLCPLNIQFNRYYEKCGWRLIKSDDDFNYWQFVN